MLNSIYGQLGNYFASNPVNAWMPSGVQGSFDNGGSAFNTASGPESGFFQPSQNGSNAYVQQGNPWQNMSLGGGFNINPLGLVGLGQQAFGGYPDNGWGNKATGIADTLSNAGTGLLNQGMQGLPSISNMGALSHVPGVLSNQASNVGVADPFTGQGGASDPYQLMPHEQEAFNQTANMVNQGRQSALTNLRQQMASRGINDPRAMAAAEASVNAAHNNMLQDTHSQLQQQAFANRQQVLQQMPQELQGLYGAQFGQQQANLGMGKQMLAGTFGGAAPVYENAANQAINQGRYNQNQLGQNLQTLFPATGGFNLGNLLQGQGGGQGGNGVSFGQGAQQYLNNPNMSYTDQQGQGWSGGYPTDPQTGMPYDPMTGQFAGWAQGFDQGQGMPYSGGDQSGMNYGPLSGNGYGPLGGSPIGNYNLNMDNYGGGFAPYSGDMSLSNMGDYTDYGNSFG